MILTILVKQKKKEKKTILVKQILYIGQVHLYFMLVLVIKDEECMTLLYNIIVASSISRYSLLQT